MSEKLLSMGTVVKIKGTNTPLMILGWFQPNIDEDGEIISFSKYMSVPATMGLQSSRMYNFDEVEIEKILYQGYVSEETENFKNDTLDWWRNNAQVLIDGSKDSDNVNVTSTNSDYKSKTSSPYGF